MKLPRFTGESTHSLTSATTSSRKLTNTKLQPEDFLVRLDIKGFFRILRTRWSTAIPPFLFEYLIGNLDVNVGPGHDDLLKLFLIKAGQPISLPLNRSLKGNHFPRMWETKALITPFTKMMTAPLLRTHSLMVWYGMVASDWLAEHFGHLQSLPPSCNTSSTLWRNV